MDSCARNACCGWSACVRARRGYVSVIIMDLRLINVNRLLTNNGKTILFETVLLNGENTKQNKKPKLWKWWIIWWHSLKWATTTKNNNNKTKPKQKTNITHWNRTKWSVFFRLTLRLCWLDLTNIQTHEMYEWLQNGITISRNILNNIQDAFEKKKSKTKFRVWFSTYLWLCIQCVRRHHDCGGFMHFILVLDGRFWWMTNDQLGVRIAISHMCS